jgi:hypothetical protein
MTMVLTGARLHLTPKPDEADDAACCPEGLAETPT